MCKTTANVILLTNLYTVSQKGANKLLAVTLSDLKILLSLERQGNFQ